MKDLLLFFAGLIAICIGAYILNGPSFLYILLFAGIAAISRFIIWIVSAKVKLENHINTLNTLGSVRKRWPLIRTNYLTLVNRTTLDKGKYDDGKQDEMKGKE